MSETKQIIFSFQEIAESLVKKQGIHDGIWGVYVRFGIKASNMGPSSAELRPAAIIPIMEIGIQRFDEENNLTVDAAKVNPATTPKQAQRKPPKS